MLAARAIGLGIGGAGLLSNAPWLVAAAPGAVAAAVIFTMIAGMAMQFFEAVFCIYVLFNRQASMAVKLNRAMSVYFSKKPFPGRLWSRWPATETRPLRRSRKSTERKIRRMTKMRNLLDFSGCL